MPYLRIHNGWILGLCCVGLLLPRPAFADNSVTRWVEQAMQTVRDRNIGTPAAGRVYAMVTVAIYDAVNGIDRRRHHGYEHALVPADGAPVNGNRDAAVAAAAHAVLKGLAPAQESILDAALLADLAALGATDHACHGRAAVGRVSSVNRCSRFARTTARRPRRTCRPGPRIGEHRAAFDARFRHMTPFGIASIAPYSSPAPPALSSAAYAAAYNDVKTFGQQDGDAERNEIALFWLAEGGTVRETGTWMQALVAIVDQQGTSANLSDTARVFALVGMAIADAVAAVWETKAQYFTWRPAIAIHEGDLDGNDATDVRPLMDTAEHLDWGFPGIQLRHLRLCRRRVRRHRALLWRSVAGTSASRPIWRRTVARCYVSALAGAEEAGRSRIYQGIHFQFSNVDGRRIGRAIGQEIATTRLLRISR